MFFIPSGSKGSPRVKNKLKHMLLEWLVYVVVCRMEEAALKANSIIALDCD